MTEFAVVLTTFLVPLFMIVPLLGQIISMRQDAESAVRYAAWQRTIWKGTNADIDPNFQATEAAVASTTVKSDDTIAQEVDNRIFASGDAQIYTSQPGATLQLKPFHLTSLTAPVGGGQVPLLDKRPLSLPANPRYATQASTNSKLSGVEGTLIRDGVTNAVPPPLRFNLDTKGLIQAQVSFSLIQIPDWIWPTRFLGSPQIAMTRKLTLFSDAWTPGGRYDERYRVAGLLIEEIKLDNATIHGYQNRFDTHIAKEIRCNSYESDCYLDFGYTNVDAVPSSRLSN
jgi:hypothetical protein